MVQQVGKLSELSLPRVKLSEKDEDCMNAISETKNITSIHMAKVIPCWFLDQPTLPNYLLRSFVCETDLTETFNRTPVYCAPRNLKWFNFPISLMLQ